MVTGSRISPLYTLIRDSPSHPVLIEFPFGESGYEIQAAFYAGYHRRPIVNGYSGFFPEDYMKAHDLTYPALQADAAGNAAVGFTISSHRAYPSTGYSLLRAGSSQFGSVVVTGHGTGPYDPHATRWGDYGWATLELGTNHVWLASEYVPPKSSQTADGRRNWGTRITEVTLP